MNDPYKPIQPNWESYLEKVVSPNASAVQLTETKRAFYAGAITVMGIVKHLPDDEKRAVSVLEAIQAELDAYAATQIGGH